MNIKIMEADFSDPSHEEAVISLLDGYALDIMGGGEELSPHARRNLAGELQKRSEALALLAFVDGKEAGLAICFEGFSTFACKPLLNIHDLAVAPSFRGRGVGTRLLEEAERRAKKRGCCKMTLEVLEKNDVAKRIYEKFGFKGYELDPEMGQALFFEKKLTSAMDPES